MMPGSIVTNQTNLLIFALAALAAAFSPNMAYVFIAVSFGVYLPEMFPTEVRRRDSGIATMVARVRPSSMPPFVVHIELDKDEGFSR